MTDTKSEASDRVNELDKQIRGLSLGDLCLLAGQALNMGISPERVDIILRYLEIGLTKRSLEKKWGKPGA